jgi:hypothetical protein
MTCPVPNPNASDANPGAAHQRRRHLRTVSSHTRSDRAITAIGCPWAAANTIVARVTSRCWLRPARVNRVNARRCEPSPWARSSWAPTNASGDLVFCGAVSSGLSRTARTALHARLSEIESPRSPFTDMPSSAAVRWVHPRVVATIEYREFSSRFRHPAFKGLLRADPTNVPLPTVE